MTLDDPTKLTTTTDATLPKPAAAVAGTGGLAPSATGATSVAAPKLAGSNGLAAGIKPPTVKAPSLNDSVADKVQALISQDSPLMQQAKTTALKTANRRGLLNSSMAVGASQDAMVRTALPIASQDASQAFQKNMQANDQAWQSGEKALDRTQQTSIVDKQITSTESLAALQRSLEEKLQANTITAQERQQLADIRSREGLAAAQRDLDLKMQSNSITAAEQQQIRQIQSTEGIAAADRKLQELLQSRDIASREGMAAADRNLQSGMQDKQIASQQTMQGRDIASQQTMQQSQIGSQQTMQEREITSQQAMQKSEIAYQTTMRGLDRDLQEKLASWNLKSADRNAAAQFLSNMQSSYDDSYNSIMANPNLDAATRTAQLTSAKNLRDKNLNLVEQMYQVDLKWTDADYAASPDPAKASAYLARNPDVAAAVRSGQYASAEDHYAKNGKAEGRAW